MNELALFAGAGGSIRPFSGRSFYVVIYGAAFFALFLWTVRHGWKA